MTSINPRAWRRSLRLGIIAFATLTALTGLFSLPRLPLGAHYHDFADRRTFFGIPNTEDVLSNIPFFLVGIWGCLWLITGRARYSFRDPRERLTYFIFFLGVMITGVGSAWYHLSPSNERLPWDLLPMTCSFVAILIATIMERISIWIGFLLLGPLLLCGAASVVYWYISEQQGYGDYKFYLSIQLLFPMLIALVVALFPSSYSGLSRLIQAFVLFVTAKVCEILDYRLFSFNRVVSGHALKHVAAGISCLWILIMLKERQRIAKVSNNHNHSKATDEDWPTLARG